MTQDYKIEVVAQDQAEMKKLYEKINYERKNIRGLVGSLVRGLKLMKYFQFSLFFFVSIIITLLL